MPLLRYVEIAAGIMEAGGIIAMLVGACFALVGGALSMRAKPQAAFQLLRWRLGKAILLGLEFLVAADIIRTVSTVPSIERVTVLAIIVLIRTFLSFTLEVEIDGRWPWQDRRG